jgi:WhiB family redox-sensing transcriptional regulator
MRHHSDGPRTEDNGTPTSWMAYARCRDVPPEVFFPSDGAGVEVAQRYCAACPVACQCLDYALENHIQHGVWGGASERKRRRITQSLRARVRRPGTSSPLTLTQGDLQREASDGAWGEVPWPEVVVPSTERTSRRSGSSAPPPSRP